MKVQILAVGRLKAGPERALYERYMHMASKSGRQLGIAHIELQEFGESRRNAAADRRGEEASAMLAAADTSTRLIALDETGADLTSRQFAALFENALQSGTARLAFAIGGPDGHGDAIKSRAEKTVRFGALTWPHRLMRILLAEQIYRAMTILSGHPYHRD